MPHVGESEGSVKARAVASFDVLATSAIQACLGYTHTPYCQGDWMLSEDGQPVAHSVAFYSELTLPVDICEDGADQVTTDAPQ